ncbi:MAG: hypothetical protein VW771_10505, partial [Gammaproteobacteria bacterium]
AEWRYFVYGVTRASFSGRRLTGPPVCFSTMRYGKRACYLLHKPLGGLTGNGEPGETVSATTSINKLIKRFNFIFFSSQLSRVLAWRAARNLEK